LILNFNQFSATMKCHDQRGPSRAFLHGLCSQVAFERKLEPRMNFLNCLGPSLHVAGWSKKSGLRARFSAHPQPAPRAWGRCMLPGDGWAARRRAGATPKPICPCFIGRGCGASGLVLWDGHCSNRQETVRGLPISPATTEAVGLT
jgi:hypothetical protein